MQQTPLDQAYLAMAADENARLGYYERLAESELFLLLEKESDGNNITPELFQTDMGSFVLAFDREERLAAFTEKEAAFVALSGRIIAQMLAGKDIGLGVNLGCDGVENLIAPDGIGWLLGALEQGPIEENAMPRELSAPKGLPEVLITALDRKLPTAMGLATSAYLAAVTYDDGRKSHLMAFIDSLPGAQSALAQAVNEALVFSGVEAGEIDVIFAKQSDEITQTLDRVGLRFDIPQPMPETTEMRPAPGSDPEKPPILR